MKLFKELYEEQKDRNRGYRFSGWIGMVIKIAILIGVLLMIKVITSEYIGDLFEIFGVKRAG